MNNPFKRSNYSYAGFSVETQPELTVYVDDSEYFTSKKDQIKQAMAKAGYPNPKQGTPGIVTGNEDKRLYFLTSEGEWA